MKVLAWQAGCFAQKESLGNQLPAQAPLILFLPDPPAILHGLHFSHCSSFSWEHSAWILIAKVNSFLATFAAQVELVVQPHWSAVCVLWCRTVHDPPSYFMLSQPGCCHDVTLSVYTAALLCKRTEVNVHISMATEAVNNTSHMP